MSFTVLALVLRPSGIRSFFLGHGYFSELALYCNHMVCKMKPTKSTADVFLLVEMGFSLCLLFFFKAIVAYNPWSFLSNRFLLLGFKISNTSFERGGLQITPGPF